MLYRDIILTLEREHSSYIVIVIVMLPPGARKARLSRADEIFKYLDILVQISQLSDLEFSVTTVLELF